MLSTVADELAPVAETDEADVDDVDDFLKANDAAIAPEPGLIPVCRLS